MKKRTRPDRVLGWAAAFSLVLLLGADAPDRGAKSDARVNRTDIGANRPLLSVEPEKSATIRQTTRGASSGLQNGPRQTNPAPVAAAAAGSPAAALEIKPQEVLRSLSTVAIFALASLAPAAVLMLTAFVRINVVLVLLRQALGSPQVPGNQVLTALGLLLTALVMRPVGESVYNRSVAPFAEGKMTWQQAYAAGVGPVRGFMLEQLERTHHENYLWAIHDEVASPGAAVPVNGDDFPIGEVATAFLLSELTTALVIGFLLYLPFLVVDLVVSAVLSAMGLFMLPPSLVALPLKLILFVLVNGWLHVATMLLRGFGPVGSV